MAAGRRRIAAGIAAAVVAAAAVAAVLAIAGHDSSTGRTGGSPDGGSPSGAAGGPTSAGTNTGAAAGSETAGGLVATARAEAAAGHYVRALGLYQRAHALDPAPSTLLEVGRMQHLSGRCREAHRTTQRVLAASPPGDIAAAAQNLLTRIGRCD